MNRGREKEKGTGGGRGGDVLFSPLSLPSLFFLPRSVHFGNNDELITNAVSQACSLGTPKSHTRKKKGLLCTADFRVIYTSYLVPEAPRAARAPLRRSCSCNVRVVTYER